MVTKLSEDLLPIYRLELEKGNFVERVDEPAGSNCPYAIIFGRPLHKKEIETRLGLSPEVEYRECHDCHYPLEAGYYSKASRHAIAGPIDPVEARLYDQFRGIETSGF